MPERDARSEEHAAQLRAILDTAVDGIITIDPAGTIESANPAACAIFGYALEELVGRPITVLMPPPYRDEHDGYVQNYLETGDAKIIGIGREVTGVRRDGEIFPLELAVSEVRFGDALRFTGFVRDISDRRRTEIALEESRRHLRELVDELEDRVVQRTAELQSANEELRSFAHVVSHDLKAPLRGIGTLVDWLQRDCSDGLDERGREYLALMKSRVARLYRMIEGILAYSRAGRIALTVIDVPVGDVVRDVLDGIAVPAGVRVDVAPDLPVVRYDPTQLSQVFQNLIGNAIQHLGKPDGVVTVGWEPAPPEALRFFVRDTGHGIDARHFERIFQVFESLDRHEDSPSTGVGLAIVRRIVTRHGGQIDVASEVGRGTTFWFTIPTANPTPARTDRTP